MNEELEEQSVHFGPLVVRFDERVLRPRPWTIAQSRWAADILRDTGGSTALELCTGAGQIGLGLAALVPVSVVLVDIDERACSYARSNALAAGLSDRVEVRRTSLAAAAVPGESFDLVLADPPWVPRSDTRRFPLDPLLAIDGGEDGLEVATECLDVIDRVLADGGSAILQLGTVSQVGLLSAHLDAHQHLALSVGEVRDFGADGVLMRLDRIRWNN